MKKIIRAGLLVASLAGVGSGCAAVSSSMSSSTAMTGEAWYVESTGFFGFYWGSRVFYCPAATSAGPSTCTEAKLVPLTKEQQDAQKPPK
jgi:hypothetical protein